MVVRHFEAVRLRLFDDFRELVFEVVARIVLEPGVEGRILFFEGFEADVVDVVEDGLLLLSDLLLPL